MARIKIKDLPKNMKISRADLEKIQGGIETVPLPEVRGRISIGTWPTPERPSLLKSNNQGRLYIDTVPLPE
jgi:hypothetical protein